MFFELFQYVHWKEKEFLFQNIPVSYLPQLIPKVWVCQMVQQLKIKFVCFLKMSDQYHCSGFE